MRDSKSYTFDASHILPRHIGKCGRLHGHTYEIDICIEGKVSKETQFVLDYGRIDELVKPLIEKWDHQHLNFYIAYPSAENIATRIAAELHPQLPGLIEKLIVFVSETTRTKAIWRSDSVLDMRRLKSETDIECQTPTDLIQVKMDVENYLDKWIVTNESV